MNAGHDRLAAAGEQAVRRYREGVPSPGRSASSSKPGIVLCYTKDAHSATVVVPMYKARSFRLSSDWLQRIELRRIHHLHLEVASQSMVHRHPRTVGRPCRQGVETPQDLSHLSGLDVDHPRPRCIVIAVATVGDVFPVRRPC